MPRDRNTSKEQALEELVEVILESLKDEGHIIEDYHLMRARDFPDFWVLDRNEREYLLECKNLAHNVDRKGKLWLHNLRWVRKNVLSKDWTNAQYFARAESGSKHRVTVHTKSVKPTFVCTHWNFDREASDVLQKFFEDGLIVAGDQIGKRGNWAFNVYEQLRNYFTREKS